MKGVKWQYRTLDIIIITCKTALFEPYPSLEDSTTFDPVSTSLDFATIIFHRGRSSGYTHIKIHIQLGFQEIDKEYYFHDQD
jgi:hypothetical protein